MRSPRQRSLRAWSRAGTVAPGLALRRMRSRPLIHVGIALAVGFAGWLVGWSSISSARAHEAYVRERVEEAPLDRRAVQVVYHVPIGTFDSSRRPVDALFRRFDEVLTPARRVQIWHAVVGQTKLVVADEPARDVVIRAGRRPRQCRAATCDVLALQGDFELGERVQLAGGVVAVVVGRALIRPDALPDLASTPALGEEALLAWSDEGTLLRGIGMTGMSSVTTAALDPQRVDAAGLRRLDRRFQHEGLRLTRERRLLTVTTPRSFLDELADRGDVARERLLLIAGQGALLIVSFAAFAARARRRELAAVSDQLAGLGATRRQQVGTRLVEVVIPVAVGAAAAVVVLLAAGQILDVAAIPRATLATIAATAAIAVVLLAVSLGEERRPRYGIGALELAAATALALLVWQAVATGGLEASEIAAGGDSGPFLFVLPGLAFFVTAVVLLRLVPAVLQLAERGARRAPFALRLSLISAARHRTDVAGATTFLAIALGASLFALNYGATLRRQTEDEAAFRAGARWRVLERRAEEGSRAVAPSLGGDVAPPAVVDAPPLTDVYDVTPLSRFARASGERPTPAIRLAGDAPEAATAEDEVRVEVLALPAGALGTVSGWRKDFSDLELPEIQRRLAAGNVKLTGPRVARDASALRVRMRADEVRYERLATLHFLRPADQTFLHFDLGLVPSRAGALSVRLDESVRGAELIGVEFAPVRVPFSGPANDFGEIEIGAFEQRRGERWVPLGDLGRWAAAELGSGGSSGRVVAAGAQLRFQLNGTPLALMHPAIDETIPAVVSPAVARHAVDGLVTLIVSGRQVVVRVVGRAELFPTIVERPAHFVVADYDALFASLNADFPGVAAPTEAWFFRPEPAAAGARLARAPFRVSHLVRTDALESRLVSDPLAAGARAVLALSAFAAALLAVVGLVIAARSSLVSQRQVLAEYEALGVRPTSLVRSGQMYFALVSSLGVVAALVGALSALGLVASFVAITAGAERPIVPIVAVPSYAGTIAVLVAVSAVALGSTALLTRRAMSRPAAARLRG